MGFLRFYRYLAPWALLAFFLQVFLSRLDGLDFVWGLR